MNQNIKELSTTSMMHYYPEHQEPFADSFLHALSTPTIRVVPESDWSSIKALWVARFHHDYGNRYEQKETIAILDKKIDRFGSVQGLLTMTDSDYTPYLTTFFNPSWTPDHVLNLIKQAFNQPITTTLAQQTDGTFFQKKIVGKADNGLTVMIYTNKDNEIIDAFPIFMQESNHANVP
jgi:hypothetical protein